MASAGHVTCLAPQLRRRECHAEYAYRGGLSKAAEALLNLLADTYGAASMRPAVGMVVV